MGEEQNRFSLRKLSVGLASVLIGVSIFGTSQTVKADTVANNQTSSVTNNAQSSDTQKNENAAKSTFSSITPYNNVKSNLIQTQDKAKNDQTDSLNQNSTNSQEANNSNDLQEKSAEKNIVSTSSLQESNNQSNTVTEKTVQHDTLESGQKAQSFNLPKNSQLAKKVLATNLIETTSSPTTNGGFDEATWGKLDVNNWQGFAQDGVYQLVDYTGDLNHIIVPNEADFEQVGKSTNGLQVGITSNTVRSLVSRNQGKITIAFSKTNNQKVKAIGTDWSYAFSPDTTLSTLSKFDGSSLDVSNVTSMNWMFGSNSISDLTPLANWNTSKVTSMAGMFNSNSISDLKPLAHWDTSKVTNMSYMFYRNKISDLKPLIKWNTSKVTSMAGMFGNNSVSDLTSLAHWDTSNVTAMNSMFYNNFINDLTPLTNWDTSKVTDMNSMFASNSISNLGSLIKWNTSNVTDMNWMFWNNQISDLKPLTNWDTSKVTDMSNMFSENSISDLTPLTNWDTSKVTDMSNMFGSNPAIIDLKPIANWNISGDSLFRSDTKLNLTNIKDNAPLMQGFLKAPNALQGATFITNNADLIKATTGKDLPDLTNTAKRTITFNIPHATPETIVQIINYKAIAPVQVNFNSKKIVKTYPVKDSDWQLDTSKQNDAIIVNGQIHFKAVKIPHINGYKAHLVRKKLNPAMFMVSFIAIPTENKPSNPIEEIPSKPSANPDNTNKPASDLQQRVVTELNSNDSGWTMPENNSTYKVEIPADDAIIDLSDLVIAEPVHAQTRTQIRVTKRFKLRKHGKKHVAKHLKHRKKAVKSFKKYRL